VSGVGLVGSIALAVALVGVSARAGEPARSGAYEGVRREYQGLAEDGPRARDAEAWRSVADRFRRARAEASGADRADDALYMAGICYERANALSGDAADQDAAVAAYQELVAAYSSSRLADDALLRAARVRELQGDTGGAATLYRRLLSDYPAGDMAGSARRRLGRVGQGGAVTGVRHFSGPNYTRVVLDLSASTPFAARSLAADVGAGRPHRVFLDLPGGHLGTECPACEAISDGLVRQVRAGRHDRDTVRVVLDLEAPAEFRAFPLDGPPRIVVDVFRDPPTGDLVGGLLPGTSARPAARRARVVLDPGHGGRDPGALGIGGLREKDVTLAIARELRDLLRRAGGWEVKLTREGDATLSLEERTAIANAFGADLFISIHANASPNREARGVETYYLERSSDRAARRLAAKENGGREEDAAEMEHILADVVLSSKVRDSRRLAQEIQGALVADFSEQYGPTRDLGVKRGPFYVLTGAVMPAVLVETAFLTHPEESRRLADATFQREAAEALARGISRFSGGT